MDVAVLWLQRDLRLHDNPALTAALLTAKKVVITYIWAKEEEGQFQPGRASRWWLRRSLQSLEAQVRSKGAYICYRRGPSAVDQLIGVCKEVGANCVFFNHVYDPLSLVRDHDVKQRLGAEGIFARSFNAEVLYEPWDVLDTEGKPFSTYEAFWHKVTTNMPSPTEPNFVEPLLLPTVVTPELTRLSLDDLGLESPEEQVSNAHFSREWNPGTAAGLACLLDFLDNRLPPFDHDRAKVDRNSTSRLSPYIHFGEISVRVIHHEVQRRRPLLQQQRPDTTACSDFLKQVGYREYSRYLSFHFPFTHERALLEHLRAVPWVQCPMRFRAWRQGETGYPIVDAAMRQLWATGWMHNRARVFTASFLVKNLLLPWQWGLKHFWDMLLDADLECDALGWQYVSGCLVDAMPFLYLMDIEQESKRFDPEGDYIKRWVPELARLPPPYIYQPWTAPAHVLEAAGVRLGSDYPMPIVTLAESQAALVRANGIVQRCQVPAALQPEPYRTATFPVDIAKLEPEEEVEQGSTQQRSVVPACPNATQTSIPSASGTGTIVRIQTPLLAAAAGPSGNAATAAFFPVVMSAPTEPTTSGRASCGSSGNAFANSCAVQLQQQAFAPVRSSMPTPASASGHSSRGSEPRMESQHCAVQPCVDSADLAGQACSDPQHAWAGASVGDGQASMQQQRGSSDSQQRFATSNGNSHAAHSYAGWPRTTQAQAALSCANGAASMAHPAASSSSVPAAHAVLHAVSAASGGNSIGPHQGKASLAEQRDEKRQRI